MAGERMRPGFGELEAFYASRQGQLARRLIAHQLRHLWPDLRGRSVLGLGYACPYLNALEDAERTVALMPVENGAKPLDGDAAGRAALVREDDLPLADGSVDRALLVHALEGADDPGRLLREVWRVLADGGRLVAVVPNRRGLWSLSDRTPFGHGQPYSSGQLARRLSGQLFEPGAERGALYLPPTGSRLLLRLAVPAERLGLGLAPHFGGVVLLEAEKRIYVGTPLRVFEKPRARRYAAAVPRHLVAARKGAVLPSAPSDDLPRAA